MGCHRLIRDGEAVLVTCAAEVVELVGPLEVATPTAYTEPGRLEFAAPGDRAAFDALGRRTLAVDQIALTAGLSPRDMGVALGRLEAGGLVERAGVGWRRTQRAPLT